MNVGKNFGQLVACAVLSILSTAPVAAQVSKDAPVPPVRRDDPAPAAGEARAPVSGSDRQMMETMARANVAETDLGRIAETNAASTEVKTYARQMVADHSKANRELQEIAARKGVKLPAEPDAADRKFLEDVKTKAGPEFDSLYVSEAAVKDHTEAKELFERAAKTAEDPDLRKYAASTLPVIDHHLEMARQLNQSVNGAGSGAAGQPRSPFGPRT